MDSDPNEAPIYATGLDYMENRVYLADNRFGLRIIDVSNPENPYQIGTYEQVSEYADEGDQQEDEATSSGGHLNLWVQSVDGTKLAFVLDQYLGLRIFDVSIDSAPVPLDTYDMRTSVYFGQLSDVVDVVADNRYAYVSDAAYGIAILDFFSNPDAPGTVSIEKEGQIKTPGSSSGLALSTDKQTLFLADGNQGLLVADVSDPTAAAFDQTEDISYPENLVKSGSYTATGAYAVRELDDGAIFLASGKEGLARLQKAGGLSYDKSTVYDPPSDTTALFVDESYAYILDDDGPDEGLRIIKLEDEAIGRSALFGFVPTPGKAHAIAVHESFAYVADGAEGIAMIDITDKEAPVIADTFFANGNIRDIKILENEDKTATAYIADSRHGLIIAKLDAGQDNEGKLSETGIWPLDNARALEVYDHTENDETRRYVMLVNDSGLTLVDVTEPGAPEEKGFLDTSGEPGAPRDLGIKHPYAIIAHGSGGVFLVDISDPGKPEIIATHGAEGTAEAVSLYEAYIHTAVGERGLLVLGISDTDPVELTPIDVDPSRDIENAYYDTPGYAVDIFVNKVENDNRYTYVADTHGGFLSFLHSDVLGGGINEQPFTESPDATGCFIKALIKDK